MVWYCVPPVQVHVLETGVVGPHEPVVPEVQVQTRFEVIEPEYMAGQALVVISSGCVVQAQVRPVSVRGPMLPEVAELQVQFCW